MSEKIITRTTYKEQWRLAKDLYNRKQPSAYKFFGVELVVRIILILSQLAFLSMLVRYLTRKQNSTKRRLATEKYVIAKLAFSLILCDICGSFSDHGTISSIIYLCSLYLILETLFYTGNLLINNDIFPVPYSDKRNIILLIVDYVTVNIYFATMYLINHGLNFSNLHSEYITSPLISIYYCMVSALTIGYGDVTVNTHGYSLALFHGIVILLFGVVFINYYVSKIVDGGASRR